MAKTLRHLGKPSRLPASPQAATLDRVANPHPDTEYVARFTAPEFTTLCPITGQPDFAYLVIDYAPGKWLLESKSFKLYLGSFRNIGAVLKEASFTFADIVRINSFVVAREHLKGYMGVRDLYIADPPPASTLMIVSGFSRPEFLVEVEIIAAAP